MRSWWNRRSRIAKIAVVIWAVFTMLVLFVIVVVVTAPATDEEAQAVATPQADATQTPEDVLREFTLCSRLKANKTMIWGQASGVIYSGDPSVTGQIEIGDYVTILTPRPDDDGNIRVQVSPHDDRTVGVDGKVWINWASLIQTRTERDMFTCESAEGL